MSLKVLTSEYMISNHRGTGVADTWRPRVLTQVMLPSTKDGPIKLSPDPVEMINGDLAYYNNTPDRQNVMVLVNRPPREIVAQSPGTVVIHDGFTFQVGKNPQADYPNVTSDTFGGRIAVDRDSVDRNAMRFGRFYLSGEASQAAVPIGIIQPGDSLHFRYVAWVQTPGTWVTPGPDVNFEARWEAKARFARLVALGSPVGSA